MKILCFPIAFFSHFGMNHLHTLYTQYKGLFQNDTHTKEVKKKKRTDTFQIYNHHLSLTDCVHFYAKKVSFFFVQFKQFLTFFVSLLFVPLLFGEKPSCIQINNARMLIAIKIKYMDKVGQLSPLKKLLSLHFFHRLLT